MQVCPHDNPVMGPQKLTEAVSPQGPQLLSGRDGSQTLLQVIQLCFPSNILSASLKDCCGPVGVDYGSTHYH